MYSVGEVADRIEAVLGARPSENSVILSTDRQRAARPGSASLVAEIPPSTKQGRARLWPAEAIEAWLEDHPIKRLRATRAAFVAAYKQGVINNEWQEQAEAVWAAQAGGMSWAQIADGIKEATDKKMSRQYVAKHYAPLREREQPTPAA